MKLMISILLILFFWNYYSQEEVMDSSISNHQNQKFINVNILIPNLGIGLEYGIKKEKLSHHFYFNFYGNLIKTVNKLPLNVTDTSIHFRNTKNENINFELQYGLYKNIKVQHNLFELNIGLNFLVGSSNFNDSYSDYYHKYILNSNQIEYLDVNNSSTDDANKIAIYRQNSGSQQSKYITFGMSASFNPTLNLNNMYVGFNMIFGYNYLVNLTSKIVSDYSNQFQKRDKNYFDDNSKVMFQFGRYF